jgi:hypothetical protein
MDTSKPKNVIIYYQFIVLKNNFKNGRKKGGMEDVLPCKEK